MKMMKVGQELFLGENDGYLQVFDMHNLKITHTKKYEQMNRIFDMIVIEDSEQLLLAGDEGLLKATKDQEIKHYFEGEFILSICNIAKSLYLVGFLRGNGLIVWNEHTDQQLFQINQDRVDSIKRSLTTNTYIIKTEKGLKLLTIKNLKNSFYSLKQLLEADDKGVHNKTDSLQVSYLSNSHLVIATTQYEKVVKPLFLKKRSIISMKVNLADV